MLLIKILNLYKDHKQSLKNFSRYDLDKICLSDRLKSKYIKKHPRRSSFGSDVIRFEKDFT